MARDHSYSQLNIYFDGLCPLCSREINHYRKAIHAERLRFVDIANPEFDAKKEGLDGRDVHGKFHVKTRDQVVVDGVDAFIEIWKTLEIWKPMQLLASSKITRPLFDFGYKIFAKVRPLLRKTECTSDYCEMPTKANVVKIRGPRQ